MESKIYNQDGKQSGSVSLPESVFGLPWNSNLVHQVVVSEAANKRNNVAHAKGRGEVRGGGKKPWRQKGTGRARHGSTRSPIWVGGGVAHGPTKEKNYEKKISKKMKAKALYVVLSEKLRQNEILFLDKINLNEVKTKEAKKVLENISKINDFGGILNKRNNSAVLAFWNKDKETERGFRNFSNLKVEELRNITPSTILNYKYLVIIEPDESVKFIAQKLGKKAEGAKENSTSEVNNLKTPTSNESGSRSKASGKKTAPKKKPAPAKSSSPKKKTNK